MRRASPVLRFECLESTNTTLKKLTREGAADGTVLIAARQTGGRGRLGRSFISPEGGIYLSMLLRPDRDAMQTATLTACAAVAVCHAIEAVCGISPGIKWPNDLLANDRKLCGILTEAVYAPDGRLDGVVLGVGINVNCDIPLSEAVSLRELCGHDTDIDALAEQLIFQLDAMYAGWLRDTRCCLDEYRRRSVMAGRRVEVFSGQTRVSATGIGITDDYALTVRTDDGTETTVTSGIVI